MDSMKLAALLQTDEEAWYTQILDMYTPYVAAVISGVAKGALTSEDIEEAAADVFFRAWCNRATIHMPTLKAYLAQIARNATIDSMRKKKQPFVPYEDDILQITAPEQTDELAIVREQKRIVEEAVNAFQEPEREIFIRFYYFGETMAAISQKLGLGTATIKTKLHRLRAKLRETMLERGYNYE